MPFPLNSDSCDLLVALQEAGSVSKLAESKGRDVSVVSRQIQQLARMSPVVQKIGQRWILTPLGQQIATWTRHAQLEQEQLLRRRSTIRIGATREFSARVLLPNLQELLAAMPGEVTPHVLTRDDGLEKALLDGEADFAFDCNRPESPSVRFRRACIEPLWIVASPKFVRRNSIRVERDLLKAPYVRFRRISPGRILRLEHELENLAVVVDDIASARAACRVGLGWSILPAYTVAEEIASGALKAFPWPSAEPEYFGVYWLRANKHLEPWIQKATAWLKDRRLA